MKLTLPVQDTIQKQDNEGTTSLPANEASSQSAANKFSLRKDVVSKTVIRSIKRFFTQKFEVWANGWTVSKIASNDLLTIFEAIATETY